MPKAKQVTVQEAPKRNIPNTIKQIDIRQVMLIGIILMAFVIGRLTQKVEDLQSGVSAANTTANTTNTTNTQATQPTAQPVSLDVIKGLWSKDVVKFGDANKKLLLVEVGDPSCPYCSAASGENHNVTAISPQFSSFKLVADGGSYVSPVTEMRKLVDNGQASFVYVYYPGHGNGEMGMKSLYCANEKGKFWDVHDLLMSDKGYTELNSVVINDKSKSGELANFLKSAIDPTFLKSCLDSGKYDSRLTADMSIASSLNVQGTPGFYINGSAYPGAYNWNDMKAAANAALK